MRDVIHRFLKRHFEAQNLWIWPRPRWQSCLFCLPAKLKINLCRPEVGRMMPGRSNKLPVMTPVIHGTAVFSTSALTSVHSNEGLLLVSHTLQGKRSNLIYPGYLRLLAASIYSVYQIFSLGHDVELITSFSYRKCCIISD